MKRLKRLQPDSPMKRRTHGAGYPNRRTTTAGSWGLFMILATGLPATGSAIQQRSDASAWRRCPTPAIGKSKFPPIPAFLSKSSEGNTMQITQKIRVRRWLLPGLLGLAMCYPVPMTYAATMETGFSPEGTALQLVLKTIESAQHEIRLMGYSFTSPEVSGRLSGQNGAVWMWQWCWTGKAIPEKATTRARQR